LTHLISKYFAQKRGNPLIKGKYQCYKSGNEIFCQIYHFDEIQLKKDVKGILIKIESMFYYKGLVYGYLMPLSTIFQQYLIDGGNWHTWGKSSSSYKSMTNFIISGCIKLILILLSRA
jgi:hypothetical protein